MTKHNFLATQAHMVRPEPTVHNFWQPTTKQDESLAQALLGTDLPKRVPGIPYEAPSCLPSRPALEVDAEQNILSWCFEGCNQQVAFVQCVDMWLGIFLLGHKWPNQQTVERDNVACFVGCVHQSAQHSWLAKRCTLHAHMDTLICASLVRQRA